MSPWHGGTANTGRAGGRVRSASGRRRSVCAVTLCVALGAGVSTTAFGQIRLVGASDADWTVLTMAPDGGWGTATAGHISGAIAGAVANCRTMSGRALGCGAYQVAIQRGFSLGWRCGRENILAVGATLEEAVAGARKREATMRRLYRPDMGSCRQVVSVGPDGAVTVPPGEAITSAQRD